jgi:hypothetical protein
MKHKMFALILALTVASWAQTATPVAPSAPQQNVPADQAKCACCDKMAATDAKDTKSCCAHHDMQAKAADGKHSKEMSCCGGKDAKSTDCKDAMSCMRNAKDKGASCCKKGCGKDACAKDKMAASCCGNKCGKGDDKGCCSGKAGTTAKTCCAKELHS